MILIGDCRETLRTLPDSSAQCCITSPPYWGLRDYGTATWRGGDVSCLHEPPQEWIDHNFNANSAFGSGAKSQGAAAKSRWYNSDGSCRCGAVRVDSQLGMERTPDEYVANMVAVFREVRRVLKDDGTCWLNLGDSYASDTKGSGGPDSSSTLHGSAAQVNGQRMPTRRVTHGLKQKDLVGIPWRVAFALQADGWWLRQDIIWAKPNPMPESVTDRCTKSHEYVFLLTKSARYKYNADAIAEKTVTFDENTRDRDKTKLNNVPGRKRMGGLTVNQYENRNRRDVWSIPTEPTPFAHFATMPSQLVKLCMLAGSDTGDTVLDPFFGSGTVGMVAEEYGRKWIGCELNGEYVKIAKKRTAQTGLNFQ